MKGLLIGERGWITGNQGIRGIEVFHGLCLLIDDFQEPTIELVNNGTVDEKLDIAADGVTDSVGPGPGGANNTLAITGIVIIIVRVNLRSVDVGEVDDESRPRDEFALYRERADRCESEIGLVIEFDAAPLGGPTGATAHNGFVEFDGWFSCGCIQAFAVLETAGHDVEHGGGCGGHLWFPTWLMGLDRVISYRSIFFILS